MPKPDKIASLEKILNIEFKEVPLSKIMEKRVRAKASFSLNSQGNIRGLRMNQLHRGAIIKDISSFLNLEQLNIDDNYIRNISGLTRFKKLQRLSLCDNKISKFEPLEKLPGLKELDISGNYRMSPDCLKNLVKLEKLKVTTIGPNDISFLEKLVNLKHLDLRSNSIEDLSPMVNLRKLEVLFLHNNMISNLSPLSFLINLKNLYLTTNQITDPSALVTLKKLDILKLDNNPITRLPLMICDFPKMEIQWKRHSYDSGFITLFHDKILPVYPPKEIISLGKKAVRKYLVTPRRDDDVLHSGYLPKKKTNEEINIENVVNKYRKLHKIRIYNRIQKLITDRKVEEAFQIAIEKDIPAKDILIPWEVLIRLTREIPRTKVERKIPLKKTSSEEILKWANNVQLQNEKLNINELAISIKALKKLFSSTRLDLYSKKLTTIPSGVFKLTHLKSLILNWNLLTEIPDEISKLKDLEELEFAANKKLKYISVEILQLKKLKSLSLGNCLLGHFPKFILEITKLEKLHFTFNSLTDLPEEIGNLINLRNLSLTGNRLTCLPESFAKLKKLGKLYLDENSLTKLPEFISKFKNLTELLVQKNQITNIPYSYNKIKSLEKLTADTNVYSAEQKEKFYEPPYHIEYKF